LSDNSPVPLIVFAPQREPSEFINSLMRKAGEPVHCTWIPAVRDLGEALEQLNPELLICAYVPDADIRQAATIRDQLAPQVPMLLVRPQISETDIANGMRLGARDVVSLSATDRVQAVVSRELRTFRLERALNSTLQSASDYRRQLQSVLQRSNDAILQVQEGIAVDANQTWLELFGYEDAGVVVGQPLMDLFDDRSHAALKGALVACGQGKWSDHPLKVHALLGDGTQLQLDLVLTPGEFENEPCVRIMVPARKRDDRQLTTDLNDAVKRDTSTGLLMRRPLLDAIGVRIAAPPAGGVRFMALVRPDKFAELEKDVGVRSSEQLVSEYAATLKSYLGPNDIAGRFAGVSFLVLIERGNTHDVEAWAEAVLARFGENTSTVGQKSVHSTCTIGLTAVPTAGLDRRRGRGCTAGRAQRPRPGRQPDFPSRQGRHRHARAGLRHDLGQAHQVGADGKPLPPGAAAGREPAGRGPEHVRRAGAHARQPGQGSPARGLHGRCRTQRPAQEHRPLGGGRLVVVCCQGQARLPVRAPVARQRARRRLHRMAEVAARGWQTRAAAHLLPDHREHRRAVHERRGGAARRLKKLGFRIALERFGSGRDPYKLLTSVPLDFIKIDGALVQDLAGNSETQIMVKKLVETGVKLKIETIAERVEDANTMAVLWQLGVQFHPGLLRERAGRSRDGRGNGTALSLPLPATIFRPPIRDSISAMSIYGLLTFCAVYAIAVATPGPGIAAVIARSLAHGFRGRPLSWRASSSVT
jgi:GGDEF domain-containing protein